MKRFELRQEHVTLLRAAYVWWDDSEFGAPAIDCKRPYGTSSGIPAQIAGELLKWPPDGHDRDGDPWWSDETEAKAVQLHKETETALQIVLRTGAFEPGHYEADDYDTNWRRVAGREG